MVSDFDSRGSFKIVSTYESKFTFRRVEVYIVFFAPVMYGIKCCVCCSFKVKACVSCDDYGNVVCVGLNVGVRGEGKVKEGGD